MVVTLLHMYRNTIPIITSFYSLLVLSKSGLQVPLCLTYAYLVTTFAGNLVNYRSLLLLWHLLLDSPMFSYYYLLFPIILILLHPRVGQRNITFVVPVFASVAQVRLVLVRFYAWMMHALYGISVCVVFFARRQICVFIIVRR